MKMNCMKIKEYISASVESMFRCHIEGEMLVVTTPFAYPDGDDIELFVESKNDFLILSDMGETLRYLDTYLLDLATQKRKSIINDIVKSYNIRFEKGIFYAIVKNLNKFLDALFNLSQAIIRISDLIYTIKGQSFASFEEEVKEFLEDNDFNFESNFMVETSNNQHNFEFAVESKEGIKLLKLINTSKPQGKTNVVNRTLRTWFEISYELPEKYPKRNRITVLDDSFLDWKPNDYHVLEPLSTINKWTQKERLITSLKKIS